MNFNVGFFTTSMTIKIENTYVIPKGSLVAVCSQSPPLLAVPSSHGSVFCLYRCAVFTNVL